MGEKKIWWGYFICPMKGCAVSYSYSHQIWTFFSFLMAFLWCKTSIGDLDRKDFLNGNKHSIANIWNPNPSLVGCGGQASHSTAVKTSFKGSFNKDEMEFYHKRYLSFLGSRHDQMLSWFYFHLKFWANGTQHRVLTLLCEIMKSRHPWTNVIFNFVN